MIACCRYFLSIFTMCTIFSMFWVSDAHGQSLPPASKLPKSSGTPAQKSPSKLDQEDDEPNDAPRKNAHGEGGDDHQRQSKSQGGTVKLPLGLPSWVPEPFDMGFEPIMDQSFRRRKTLTSDTQTLAVEGGGQFSFDNIPVFRGPAAINLGLKVGAARGRSASFDVSLNSLRQKAASNNKTFELQDNELHKRKYFETSMDIFVDWLRPKIIYGQGEIDWDQLPKDENFLSRLYGLALEVRINSVLEGLWQWRRYVAYVQSEGENNPLVSENDYSIMMHSELKHLPFSYYLDLGGGVSHLNVYDGRGPDRRVIGSGVSSTFRFVANAKFTKNFKAEAYLKYAFAATKDLENAYNGIQLPTERLNRVPLVQSAPADELSARAFVGFIDWVKNLTLGWTYYNRTKNFSAGSGARSKDQYSGPIFEYIYNF